MHDLLFKNIFEFIKGELLIIQEILCLFSYVFSFLKFDILLDFLNLLITKFKLFISIVIFSPKYSFILLFIILFILYTFSFLLLGELLLLAFYEKIIP